MKPFSKRKMTKPQDRTIFITTITINVNILSAIKKAGDRMLRAEAHIIAPASFG